jgi:ecotin
MIIKKLASFTILLGLLAHSNNIDAQGKMKKYNKLEINMFPKAKAGEKQVYIQVPIETNENDLKVEVFVGKTQLVDCNNYFMIGEIVSNNLEGWGYDYYTIKGSGETAGTLMGCLDNKKTSKFIQMPASLLRYNSRLPIVIYVPNDLEVKYRIWRADNQMATATKGKILDDAPKATNLENKRWRLVELMGKSITGESDKHYIIFNAANGVIEAKADCNVLTAPYKISNGSKLQLQPIITTNMACSGNLEGEFVQMLESINNYAINGRDLSLAKNKMAPFARFELVE